MAATDPALFATPATGVPLTRGPNADGWFAATLDLASTLDASELESKLLRVATSLASADTASLWHPHDGALICPVAVGDDASRVVGRRAALDELASMLEGEANLAVVAVPLAFGEHVSVVRVVRDSAAGGPFAPEERETVERLGRAAETSWRNIQHIASNDRARDLALVMEMSREIASTLDLDRVMQSVVNLAMKALPFDRGAIAMYERGTCDIRAVAGSETVDPEDPELQDLAVRSAWAAGIGEGFYLSDCSDPASDAERTFLQVFGDDLAADGVMSGLYIPLKDDEGVVGILVLESARPDFATPRQQELATILANQATVALRNAQLYNQVPLADALGALHARKEAFFALPRQRRVVVAGAVLLSIGALTLIRWPLRIDALSPSFRPVARAEIRPLTAGIVERVLVREGTLVERGMPVVQLRDADLRADYEAAAAAAVAADRAAAVAASRGDAAEERLQRMRADVLRREAAVREEQARAATVRSPVTGVVLSPRPEEQVGAWVDAGASVMLLGRTDTLELEFGVDQRDIGRVRVGEDVRLRVDAYPQRTFNGHVSAIADIGADSAGRVVFAVRAVVPNADGSLRPGMVAYARVLSAPASVLGRATREPARRLRLLWWRMWS